VPIPVALLCCAGSAGIYYAYNRSVGVAGPVGGAGAGAGTGAAPAFSAAKIDPNNLENTRSWSANKQTPEGSRGQEKRCRHQGRNREGREVPQGRAPEQESPLGLPGQRYPE